MRNVLVFWCVFTSMNLCVCIAGSSAPYMWNGSHWRSLHFSFLCPRVGLRSEGSACQYLVIVSVSFFISHSVWSLFSHVPSHYITPLLPCVLHPIPPCHSKQKCSPRLCPMETRHRDHSFSRMPVSETADTWGSPSLLKVKTTPYIDYQLAPTECAFL